MRVTNNQYSNDELLCKITWTAHLQLVPGICISLTAVFRFELGDVVHLTVDTIDEQGSTRSLHLCDANWQVSRRLLLHSRRQVVTT
jgi:hypothetical protein